MLKRKRVVLSMRDKHEIIQRLEKGESAINLANEYKVGKSTISDIKKQKANIESFISRLDSTEGSTSRKTMKLATNTELDDAVYKWYTETKSQGYHVTGPIICEKAIQLNETLGGPSNFRASTGWLQRFKTRHNIHEPQIQGAKLSSDSSAADSFKSKLRDVLSEEDYALENVYNAGETGLHWKAVPIKTLAPSCGLVSTAKISMARITILACANAVGNHRLPIMIIGKSKEPRCFKHVNMSAMPIVYKSEKSLIMNTTIFVEWFTDVFIPSVIAHQLMNGKREKTLLILDQALTHPSCDVLNEKDEFIKVIPLPPNVTSLIHPMDQRVIETFKRNYRKELLRKLFLQRERKESLLENLNNIDLKDASYMIEVAWNSIKEHDLKRAWNKILDVGNNSQTPSEYDKEGDISEAFNILKELSCIECDEEDIQEWMNADDAGHQAMQYCEVNLTTDKADAISISSTSDPENEDENTPSASEAFACLDTALRWFEAQDESDYRQISVLRRIRDLAGLKRAGLHKQTKIKDELHQ